MSSRRFTRPSHARHARSGLDERAVHDPARQHRLEEIEARHVSRLRNNKATRRGFVLWIAVAIALWVVMGTFGLFHRTSGSKQVWALVVFLVGCVWTTLFGAYLDRHANSDHRWRYSAATTVVLALVTVALALATSNNRFHAAVDFSWYVLIVVGGSIVGLVATYLLMSLGAGLHNALEETRAAVRDQAQS